MKTGPECRGEGLVPERDAEDNETGLNTICPNCGGSGEAPADQDDPPTKWALKVVASRPVQEQPGSAYIAIEAQARQFAGALGFKIGVDEPVWAKFPAAASRRAGAIAIFLFWSAPAAALV